MRAKLRATLVLTAAAAALALPAAAWGHAALLHTEPRANVQLNRPPTEVRLTYSEAVEPRFAVVSVTNAAGHSQTAGNPRRGINRPHVGTQQPGPSLRFMYRGRAGVP